EQVVRDEDTRLAALIVLDTLTPEQRVAFVLHDGFGVPFSQVAGTLGTSPAAARQAASRARRLVAAAPPQVPGTEHAEAVQRMVAAMAEGDVDAVTRVLHPEATCTGDAGGATRTAPNIIRGPDRMARFLLGLARMYGPERLMEMEPVLVNGRAGLRHRGSPQGPETGRHAIAPRVIACTVRDGAVWAAYDMANPAKLHGLR